MSRTGVARVDFYFEDWLTGTFEMRAELRGALITICAVIWKTGDQLKDNDEALARWNAMKVRHWRSVKAELIASGKIKVEDGFIRHTRASAELQASQKRREIAQEKGAKGGQKRIETHAIADANPLQDNKTPPSPAQAPARVLPPTATPIEESKEEEAPAAPPSNQYVWEGEVVRLTKADYDKWSKMAPDVDLNAYLLDRDPWLVANPRDNWFMCTRRDLSNRQQAITANARTEARAREAGRIKVGHDYTAAMFS
jgi:uncharacterized protein YdaU (DUF1376 family)